MALIKLRDVFRFNEKWTAVISHIIVGLMMACVAASASTLVTLLLPELNMTYLGSVGFLVALEAMISLRLLRLLHRLSGDATIYRISEWVVILIGLKLYVELRHGVDYLSKNISLWQKDFMNAFLSTEFVLALLVVVLIWVISTMFTYDLAELEGDELILSKAGLEGMTSDRRGMHERLIGRILFIGLGMVLVAGLAYQDYLPLVGQQMARSGVLNVVLYFVLGLALLSQTNFSALRAAWGYKRVTITRNLAQRWTIYSLIFMAVLLLLALILPTRYAMGFLPTLQYVIDLLFTVINFIIALIMLPFIYLFALLSRLLGTKGSTQPIPTPTPAPPEPMIENPTTPIPWLEVLKSVVFWVVLVAIVVYAVRQYVRQNQQLAGVFRQMFAWHWLAEAWRWLRQVFGGMRRSVATVVQAGLRRLRMTAVSPVANVFRFINLRRLSPRQKVLFYYLALVRRGGEAGSPRRPWQTPQEYYHSLSSTHPEIEPDVASMTEAFSEARYSRHEVPAERASLVQRFWERVRRALRREAATGAGKVNAKAQGRKES